MIPPRPFATLLVLVATLAVASLGALAATGPAQAGPNVAGTWDVEFTGGFSGTCDSIITQEGNELTSISECSLVGSLEFHGTIDPETGSVVLSDTSLGAVLNITFAPDGNSFTGTWSAVGLGGSLTGTRTGTEIELVDVSGDWTFIFDGREDDRTCEAALVQNFLDLTATITCPSGTTSWRGTANPISGSFTLESQDSDFAYISAYAPLDTSGMLGSWRETKRGGMVFAFPAGTAHGGALNIACASDVGHVTYCYAEPGETMTAVVELALPPSDGFDGFRITLELPGEPAPYLPATDPASEVPGCAGAQRTIGEETVTFTCLSGQAIEGTSPMIQITLQCSDDPAYVFMNLGVDPFDSYLTLDGAEQPLLLAQSASVECYGDDPYPYPYLPPEAFEAADVNCDGDWNAIDAALVLQQNAGLLDALPCGVTGDASMDGATNSIDASLILQMSAGLVLPVPPEGLPPF